MRALDRVPTEEIARVLDKPLDEVARLLARALTVSSDFYAVRVRDGIEAMWKIHFV